MSRTAYLGVLWHCSLFTSSLVANICFLLHRQVVEILSDLASHGKTVILSIHQPRYTVFKLFDVLMLLAEGEMVYQVIRGKTYTLVDAARLAFFDCLLFAKSLNVVQCLLILSPASMSPGACRQGSGVLRADRLPV